MKRSISAEILFILTLSLVTALMYNAFSSNGIPIFHHAVEISPDQYLSLEQVGRIIVEKRAQLIDARSEEEYASGHLPGAINIPGYASVDRIMGSFTDIDKNTMIVLYCSGVECPYADRIAGFLRFQEFSSVYVFSGGIDAWIGAGYHLVK